MDHVKRQRNATKNENSKQPEYPRDVLKQRLEIVAKDKDAEGKVVGTCDGGTKKIVYSKGEAAAKSPAKEPSKP